MPGMWRIQMSRNKEEQARMEGMAQAASGSPRQKASMDLKQI